MYFSYFVFLSYFVIKPYLIVYFTRLLICKVGFSHQLSSYSFNLLKLLTIIYQYLFVCGCGGGGGGGGGVSVCVSLHPALIYIYS